YQEDRHGLSAEERPQRSAASMRRRLLRHDDLAADSQGHIHGPSPLCVGHRDRLRHVIGIVSTVLSGLKSQPGAVAVKVLGPHRIGQLSECLYWAHAAVAFIL